MKNLNSSIDTGTLLKPSFVLVSFYMRNVIEVLLTGFGLHPIILTKKHVFQPAIADNACRTSEKTSTGDFGNLF